MFPTFQAPSPRVRWSSALLFAAFAILTVLGSGGVRGAAPAGTARYAVIELTGPIVGSAMDLNDNGQITGHILLNTPTRRIEAFRTQPLKPLNLTTDLLGLLPDGTFSKGLAINNAGQVAGEAGGTPNGSTPHAFRTGPNARIDAGSDLGPGTANGINIRGDVIGRSVGEAYRTSDAITANSLLGTLFPDPNQPGEYLGTSVANAVNDSGQVVGTSFLNQQQGFYTSGGKIVPEDAVGQSVIPRSVNAEGIMVGEFRPGGGRLAFRSSRRTVVPADSLGTLGGARSWAKDINDTEQIVGDAEDAKGQVRPFLWEDGTMQDVNTLIPADSGWTLGSAVAINNLGQILATGSHRGVAKTALLLPGVESDLLVQIDNPAPIRGATGEQMNLYVRVTNYGPGPARSVVVTLTVPEGLTVTASEPTGQVVKGKLTIRLEDQVLGVGQSKVVGVGLTSSRAAVYQCTAAVAGANEDPVPGNNTTSLELLFEYMPDLTVREPVLAVVHKRKGRTKTWMLSGRMVIINVGENASRPRTNVGFWLSTDDSLDDGDQSAPFLRDSYPAVPPLNPGKTHRIAFKGKVSRDPANKGSILRGMYLIAVIDPEDRAEESNELNNQHVWRLP